MNQKLYLFGQNIVKYISILLIGILAIASITTYVYDKNWMEVYVVTHNILLNILGIAMFIGMYSLLLYIRKKTNFSDKKWNKIYLTILFVIFIGTFITLPSPQADQANIYTAIVNFNKGNTSFLTEDPYFQVWGHMLPMVAIMKIFGGNPFAFYLFNFFLLALTFHFLMKLSNNNRYLASALVLLLPIIQYTCFYYGEFIAIFGITASVYYTTETLKKPKQFAGYFGLGFVTFIGLLYKNNFIIFIVAEILSLLLFLIKSKSVNYAKLLSVIVIATILVNPFARMFTKATLGATYNKTNNLSYIAMGMHDMGTPNITTQIEGGYDGYNAAVIYENNFDEEKINELIIQDIQKSVKNFKENPMYALNFYKNKIIKQWTTPDWCINHVVKMTRINNLQAIIKDIGKEGFDPKTYNYEQYVNNIDSTVDYMNKGMMIVIYVGMLIILLNRKNKELSLMEITLLALFIGNFIFSVFWEAKPRYCIYGYYALFIVFFSNFSTLKLSKK